ICSSGVRLQDFGLLGMDGRLGQRCRKIRWLIFYQSPDIGQASYPMRQPLISPMRTRVASKLLFSTICAALLLAGCNRSDAPADAADNGDAAIPSALTVTTTPLIRRELVRHVPATGSIFPWQEVIIAPEVGGYRVAEVMVDVGSRVRKGQQLV